MTYRDDCAIYIYLKKYHTSKPLSHKKKLLNVLKPSCKLDLFSIHRHYDITLWNISIKYCLHSNKLLPPCPVIADSRWSDKNRAGYICTHWQVFISCSSKTHYCLHAFIIYHYNCWSPLTHKTAIFESFIALLFYSICCVTAIWQVAFYSPLPGPNPSISFRLSRDRVEIMKLLIKQWVYHHNKLILNDITIHI